ncbi:SKP1-like protein 1A [Artemisia annua]|uniref:SKP1-like protein n=1 Tax=Artemisia annua TaxID=35608 RepID=A0A2U1MTH2_ARTAN|nr:SKP1-like protein 1A [Artemisia annua]
MSASCSSSSSRKNKMVSVMTSDGVTFELDEEVAMQSLAIKNMIEDGCADAVIPLPKVNSDILSKVIEYCKKHAESSKKTEQAAEDELKEFDAEFSRPDRPDMFDIIEATNYLNMEKLQDLMCQSVANWMKGKPPKEIRKYFNITNDFTPEEEAEVRKENYWVYEGMEM